jgi:hypothetical protein
MTIPMWLQRLGARVFPSIFLVPECDIVESALEKVPPFPVHPDRPVLYKGTMWFARGSRTDAEYRAFIKATMVREGDAPPQVGVTARHGDAS